MKILILGSISRSLLNFRGPLIQRLRDRGHTVIAATASDENSSQVAETLKTWGVEYHTVDIARGGTNPLADIRTRLAIQGLLRETLLARPVRVLEGGPFRSGVYITS